MTDLASTMLNAITLAAKPTATALNMTNIVPLNEVVIGDFPWFWQSGTNVNQNTYAWLNHVFAYNADSGCIATNGAALTTGLFNVLGQISYTLSGSDSDRLNKAINANQATANTVVSDWTSVFGSFGAQYNTLALQLNYITTQILSWGTPGLTYMDLVNSRNPQALLPNVPVGAAAIVNDFMAYVAATSAVSGIQASVASANLQILQARSAIAPQTPPTTATNGYMTLINGQVVVSLKLLESTGVIQNQLLPDSGTGKSFSVSFTATLSQGNVVNLTAQGGAGGVGNLDFLFFTGSTGNKYQLLSSDSSMQTCDIELTFNGVTAITPQYYAYDITTGAGWWLPSPIEQAADAQPNETGYQFNTAEQYDFAENGNFGVIGRLMIAQQPVITLTYTTSDYNYFQQIFQSGSSFSVSFLGIPLASGSSSYYQSDTSYDASSSKVTVTMTPVGVKTPVSATDQLATVVAVEMVWPGAAQ